MHKNVLRVALIATSMGVGTAQAGGLWVTEFGQPTQGRAGAGEQAGVGDATDSFLNPAAMSRLEESQILVSAGVVSANVEFDVEESGIVNGDGDGGDAGDPLASASVFYAHPLNDKWSLGVSGLALTGSALDYDEDWVGRFQTQEVSLIVIGVTPSVGYKVNDKLSLGAAVPIMYSKLELDLAVPNPDTPVEGPAGSATLDGDDTQAAIMLSGLYEFSGKTRVGAHYVSKFDFEYDGDLDSDFRDSIGTDTKLTLADVLRVALSHEFNARWSGYLTWGWDNWSEMSDVFVSTNSNGLSLSRNWEDTYHYAVGADYRLSPAWTLRGGIGYDTSPVDEDDRTPDMPIDEQIRYAIGADYYRDSGLRISGSLVYADYGDAEIDSSREPPLFGFKGEYETNEVWFATVSFAWPLGGGTRR